MITKKSLFLKASAIIYMTIALAATSCAQKENKQQRATPEAQTKQVMMQKAKMPVDGMVCNACQSNVKKTIKSVPGVTDVEVNLEKKFAVFSYDPQKLTPEEVQKAVNKKGFTAGKPEQTKQ